jgi:DNA-binding GntR family transcriptional regulator
MVTRSPAHSPSPPSGGQDDSWGAANASTEIVRSLQRRILMGEIAVGSWLRHGALAEEFGTSRTPVREALHVLQSRGIVTIEHKRGARVNGHSTRALREASEVRAELEGFAAALAAQRATDEQIAQLFTIWQDFRDAIEEFVSRDPAERDSEAAERWVVANHEFHTLIVTAAGNQQLRDTLDGIHMRFPPNTSYAAYAGSTYLLRQNLDEHNAVAEAISAHDPERARKLMAAHVRSSMEATARWAESQGLTRD